MHMCIYIYTYVYMYIYIYIHTYICSIHRANIGHISAKENNWNSIEFLVWTINYVLRKEWVLINHPFPALDGGLAKLLGHAWANT